MNYEEYSAKRDELINQIRELIAKGEDTSELKAQVAELDAKFKNAQEEMMNLAALEGQKVALNIQETATTPVFNGGAVDSVSVPVGGVAPAVEKITAENAWESDVYADAFAKVLQGKKLTDAERQAYELANENGEEYSHMTTDEGLQLVIPKTITETIWREIEDLHPFVGDIRKTYVKGTLTILKEGASTGANFYEEDEETELGKDTVAFVNLGAYELARAINLSWKMRAMATPQFLKYLADRMSEAMGDGFAIAAIHGKGKDAEKPEPTGIITGMIEDQIVEWTGDLPTMDLLLMARSKIKSGYRPVIYANSNAIWNTLYGIKDANGRSMFVPDYSADSVGVILGCRVKEEAELADTEILFAEAGRAYHMNINQQISLTTEEHNRKRNTDYCGYAILDGNIVSDKACSLLRKKA